MGEQMDAENAVKIEFQAMLVRLANQGYYGDTIGSLNALRIISNCLLEQKQTYAKGESFGVSSTNKA